MLSGHKKVSRFRNVSRFIFWGAVAWLLLVGFLALEFWPDVPQSKAGWALFILFGPPLYVLAEGAGESFWASRAGRSLSYPSRAMQAVFVVSSLVIGGAFVWGLWWLQTH
jgi:hypothetical protein